MSSHHVVRDNQEPALILHSIAYEDYPLIMNLLEWSPYVVVFDSQLPTVLEWGIKIDCIISNASLQQTLENFPRLASQLHFELQHKDIEGTIEFLIKKGHEMINLCGDFKLNKYNRTSIELVIFNKGNQYTYYSGKFEKWLPKDSILECISQSSFTFSNLIKKNREHHVEEDGLVKLISPSPFWIKEKW